ncbi:MAG: hypothetical protein L6Q35_14645 [Phycisphaerales bacterium]|nr:hypothetical protein [Phycisphaerales bacterium]
MQQFFFSHLLERRVEWLDAGFASRYCKDLVSHGHETLAKGREKPFCTSWIEQALRIGAAVPCVRDDFTSLGRFVESMADGTWGLGITCEEAKRLAERYDNVGRITHVGWNEGRKNKIVFSEVLQRRVTKLFEDQSTWAQQPDTGLWEYVREVGRPVLYEGLRRTEATVNPATGRGHRGLRVTDFGTALHDRLFPGERPAILPSLSDVVAKSRTLPDGAKVWALCKLVADIYADNFAGLTTQRQFALSVSVDTRRVILGRGPSTADRSAPVRLTALTSFQFPTVEELLNVDPWRLEEIRGTADNPTPMARAYFDALDRWKKNDNADTANELAARLQEYCEHICAVIDQGRGRHPTYLAVWGTAGLMVGTVAGVMASFATMQIHPNASGAIGYFLVGAGELAGLGAGKLVERLCTRAAERKQTGDRTWDIDGSSQPTGESSTGTGE